MAALRTDADGATVEAAVAAGDSLSPVQLGPRMATLKARCKALRWAADAQRVLASGALRFSAARAAHEAGAALSDASVAAPAAALASLAAALEAAEDWQVGVCVCVCVHPQGDHAEAMREWSKLLGVGWV